MVYDIMVYDKMVYDIIVYDIKIYDIMIGYCYRDVVILVMQIPFYWRVSDYRTH